MDFYDDMKLGNKKYSQGSHKVSAEEIKEFAGKWDPMPFHLDEELAKQSPVGKLFASGAHTISIGLKLSHTMLEQEVAVVAGLGWTDVKFPIPVCAGDELRLTSEIVDMRESKSKNDRGIIVSLNTLINQNDEVVAEYKIATMVLKKPA